MPIILILKNSDINTCLCRFDFLNCSKAYSTKLVIRLFIQVQVQTNQIFWTHLITCTDVGQHMITLSKTTNEHIFIVSLEELVSFTVWLWSGYPQDHPHKS